MNVIVRDEIARWMNNTVVSRLGNSRIELTPSAKVLAVVLLQSQLDDRLFKGHRSHNSTDKLLDIAGGFLRSFPRMAASMYPGQRRINVNQLVHILASINSSERLVLWRESD
jgi:hypothetical protein